MVEQVHFQTTYVLLKAILIQLCVLVFSSTCLDLLLFFSECSGNGP